MFVLVHDNDIVSCYRTDYCGIILKVKTQENERGSGYSKFKKSFSEDTNDEIQLK